MPLQLLPVELIAEERNHYLEKSLIKWICHETYKRTNPKITKESMLAVADEEWKLTW